jgi:pilus assembly protein FimV
VRASAIALAVALALGASNAYGFGFGLPEVTSALGQPLRMSVPVALDPDVELAPECLRIVGGTEGDPVPALSMARVTLERDGSHGRLRIESLQPVNEPVLRVAIEAGCAQHVRREFTLLLDPPGLTPPAVASWPAAGAPAATAAALAAALPPSSDLGLGMAEIQGRVGQPLSMRVPVTGAGAAALTLQCVRLGDAPVSADGAPVLSAARLDLERSGPDTWVRLVTPDPVTEPALRVVLEVGCEMPLRREYAVLLGMPLPPVADLAAAAPQPPPQAEPAPPSPPPVAKPRPPRLKAVPSVPKPAPRTQPARAPEPAAAPAPKPQAPVAAKAADRLVLSSSEPSPDAAAAAAAAREAEVMKRVQELSNEVRQLRAELAAEKERQREAAASEQRVGFVWGAVVVSLIGLGVAGLLGWRRRQSEKPEWAAIAAAAAARPTGLGRETVVPPAAPAPAPALARKPAPAAAPAAREEHSTEATETGNPPHKIEVTELHDTVQVIEQLYTSFLDRDSGRRTVPITQSAAPSDGLPLDLTTASKANLDRDSGRRTVPITQSAGLSLDLTAAPPPKSPIDAAPATEDLSSPLAEPTTRFDLDTPSQAPTDLSLDLDLSTQTPAAAARVAQLASAKADLPTAPPLQAAAPRAGAPNIVPAGGPATRADFGDTRLTQTPTELLLDLDLTEYSSAGRATIPPMPVAAPLRVEAAGELGAPTVIGDTGGSTPPSEHAPLELDLNVSEATDDAKAAKGAKKPAA